MLLQGAEGYGVRRKRPGEDMGGEGEADQPELAGAVPSKPLTPDLTATTANGPIARVPAPQIGAPGPVLKAPEPLVTPQAPQSVAQMALGTSTTQPEGAVLRQSGVQPVTAQADTTAPANAGPAPQVGAPSAPEQTQSYSYTGSAANLFPGADGKGDVSGGTDGTGWTTFDQSKSGALSPADAELNRRIQAGDQTLMNEYKQKYGADWFAKWGADQDRLGALAVNQVADPSVLAGLKGKSGAEAWSVLGSDLKNLNALRAMSPDQRTAFLNQWPEGSYDRAVIEGSMAAQGITIDSGDTGQRWDGRTQNNGPMASAVPVYSGDVRGTGINSQGLPGFGPQVGAPPGTGGYDPGNAGVTATPGKVNAVPAGGGGGAPAVGVGPSGTPAFPSTPSLPAPSVGTPGDLTNLDPVQQAMRDETLRRLQNPSPYDDALWQKEVDRAKASSDEQWKRGRDALDADLAARNINWSSVAGDKLSDFNTARARSWDDVLTGFLSDRAKGIGAARDQAFNAGSTERNYYDNLRQQAIANQFDVTKLAEALRQGREGTALDWTKLGLDALGGSTAGSADLAAGAAASAGNSGVGGYLAQWLAQFYGNKAPKPAVGTPAPAMGGAYG